MTKTILRCNNAYKGINLKVTTMKKGILVMSIVCLVTLLLVCNVSGSLIASIDKPKMVIWKNITSGDLKFQESVIVNNKNNYSINVMLSSMGDWENRITFPENNVTLNQNTSREIFYDVTVNKPGEYAGDVLVTFYGLDKEEVSLTQRFVAKIGEENPPNYTWLYVFTGIILVLLIAVIIAARRKK